MSPTSWSRRWTSCRGASSRGNEDAPGVLALRAVAEGALVRARGAVGDRVPVRRVAADPNATAAAAGGPGLRARGASCPARLATGARLLFSHRDDRAPGPDGGLGPPRDLLRLPRAVRGHGDPRLSTPTSPSRCSAGATSTATSTWSTRKCSNVFGTAADRRRVGDDDPPRPPPGQARLRPARSRARRSAVRPARVSRSATGRSSVTLLVIALTGFVLEGVRIAMYDPGYGGTQFGGWIVAQALDRGRANRRWRDCATACGGFTACWRSSSWPASPTRRPRTC